MQAQNRVQQGEEYLHPYQKYKYVAFFRLPSQEIYEILGDMFLWVWKTCGGLMKKVDGCGGVEASKVRVDDDNRDAQMIGTSPKPQNPMWRVLTVEEEIRRRYARR